MEWLIPILIVGLVMLACPLLMRFGMRGMHGGHSCGSEHTGRADTAVPDPAERVRELEREITDLKQQMAAPTDNEGPVVRKDGSSPGGVASEGGKQ